MNTDQNKKLLIEQLKKTPIVEAACQKLDIGRSTYYYWQKEDKEFAKEAEKAMVEGQYLVNDLAESQLIAAVKERNIQAIMHWLRHHHPAYTDTIQIKHSIDEELSPEQEALVRKALILAAGVRSNINNFNQKDNGNECNPTGTGGIDDKGQENQSGDN
jgi:hypothetical protein